MKETQNFLPILPCLWYKSLPLLYIQEFQSCPYHSFSNHHHCFSKNLVFSSTHKVINGGWPRICNITRRSEGQECDAAEEAQHCSLPCSLQRQVLRRCSRFWRFHQACDICVESIACRLEKKEGGAICVYIMTLGVLAPYRGLGIGTRLLNHVLDLCLKQNIQEIYLHVQTNNDDAINFYKKFGFEITERIKSYYTNIDPPDCFVLTKFITTSQANK
ncbi:uncharacterized protein [Gossypium hirsutum]|uniref:Uncharacterized protein isoform X1 n=1 Tax=Gossypium hirsutum TaxID=3635 RepID=A0ABM2ZJR8_GOSHI|nr:uncharacterized protein LOC107951977 isoform X1 [Gossypium hirsutum]